MNLEFAGSRPLASDQDDAARLDFAEGMRLFLTTKVVPGMQQRGRAALDEAFSAGSAPASLNDIRSIVNDSPVVTTGNRIMRTVQEMIWDTTYATLKDREADLLAELDAADRMGPGSVEYDPNFVFPSYFSNHEFHLQQGGYAHPLGGHVYHLGGNVFHAGLNERGESTRKLIANVPLPPDGQVRRILELACAVGMSSSALKERFPDAELIATDIAAPMVRYAHKRAVELGEDIHFKQMAAEDLRFPDGSFDLVFVHILFHEVPTVVAKQIVREVYRVLRPGGIFAISDSRDQAHIGDRTDRAFTEYHYDWQQKNNGEMHLVEFSHADLSGVMREVGFKNVIPAYSSNSSV